MISVKLFEQLQASGFDTESHTRILDTDGSVYKFQEWRNVHLMFTF